MKKVLMLGTSLASVEIVQTAKEIGYYTIVTHNLEPERSNAKQVADEYWMISTNELDILEKKCREIGIPIVEEYTVSATPLPGELATIEYPVVVKPVDGTGNKGFYPAEAQQRHRIFLLPRRVKKFQPLRLRMQLRLMWDPQKRARRRVRPKPQIQLIQKEKRWKRMGISTSSIPAA